MAILQEKLINAIESISVTSQSNKPLVEKIVDALKKSSIPENDFLHVYSYLELLAHRLEESKTNKAISSLKKNCWKELCKQYTENHAKKLVDVEWKNITNNHLSSNPLRAAYKSKH
jgi:hypothetical protein